MFKCYWYDTLGIVFKIRSIWIILISSFRYLWCLFDISRFSFTLWAHLSSEVDASGLEIGDHAVVCEDYDADTGPLRPGPASGPQVSPGSEGRGNQKKHWPKPDISWHRNRLDINWERKQKLNLFGNSSSDPHTVCTSTYIYKSFKWHSCAFEVCVRSRPLLSSALKRIGTGARQL